MPSSSSYRLLRQIMKCLTRLILFQGRDRCSAQESARIVQGYWRPSCHRLDSYHDMRDLQPVGCHLPNSCKSFGSIPQDGNIDTFDGNFSSSFAHPCEILLNYCTLEKEVLYLTGSDYILVFCPVRSSFSFACN
jgi:hypothetical protein